MKTHPTQAGWVKEAGIMNTCQPQGRVGWRASILSPSGAKPTITTLCLLKLLKVQEIYMNNLTPKWEDPTAGDQIVPGTWSDH